MPRLKLQGGKELIIFRFNCNEIKSEKMSKSYLESKHEL